MLLPEKIADAFIEFLDMRYLRYNEYSNDPENYLETIQLYMKNCFDISWNGGGTYGTCWDEDGPEGIVDEEPEPDMDELNNFLSKNYPNLIPKELNSILCFTKEDSSYDGDYYGGSTVQYSKSLHFDDLGAALISLFHQPSECIIDLDDLILEHSTLVINMSLDAYPKLKLHKELNKNLDTTNIEEKLFKI